MPQAPHCHLSQSTRGQLPSEPTGLKRINRSVETSWKNQLQLSGTSTHCSKPTLDVLFLAPEAGGNTGLKQHSPCCSHLAHPNPGLLKIQSLSMPFCRRAANPVPTKVFLPVQLINTCWGLILLGEKFYCLCSNSLNTSLDLALAQLQSSWAPSWQRSLGFFPLPQMRAGTMSLWYTWKGARDSAGTPCRFRKPNYASKSQPCASQT